MPEPYILRFGVFQRVYKTVFPVLCQIFSTNKSAPANRKKDYIPGSTVELWGIRRNFVLGGLELRTQDQNKNFWTLLEITNQDLCNSTTLRAI
jgi:hypothetical protein